MFENYMIYGANGYTGELIARRAVSMGHFPILAGRNKERIEALAKELGVAHKIFDLDHHENIVEQIKNSALVLHCAGPFSTTSKPMLEACLEAQVHYLDITGEIAVFEHCAELDDEAKKQGIVVLPGVGFDVVPSDCLSSYLSEQMPDATSLELVLKPGMTMSKGTAITMVEHLADGGAIRENGTIKSVPAASEQKDFVIDGQTRTAVTIPWGDVSTAFYSTQIPNIKVFLVAHPKTIGRMKMMRKLQWLFKSRMIKRFLQNRIKKTVKGPTQENRDTGSTFMMGIVTDTNGKQLAAKLKAMEGYKLTIHAAVASVELVLSQNIYPGFKTPSMAFGSDFVLNFEQSERQDVLME